MSLPGFTGEKALEIPREAATRAGARTPVEAAAVLAQICCSVCDWHEKSGRHKMAERCRQYCNNRC